MRPLDDLLVRLPAEPPPPGLAMRICRAVRARAKNDPSLFLLNRRARQAAWGLEAFSLLLFGLLLSEMAGGSPTVLFRSLSEEWHRITQAAPSADWVLLHSVWNGVQALGVTALPLALACAALGAFLLAIPGLTVWMNTEKSGLENNGFRRRTGLRPL